MPRAEPPLLPPQPQQDAGGARAGTEPPFDHPEGLPKFRPFTARVRGLVGRRAQPALRAVGQQRRQRAPRAPLHLPARLQNEVYRLMATFRYEEALEDGSTLVVLPLEPGPWVAQVRAPVALSRPLPHGRPPCAVDPRAGCACVGRAD